MWLLRKLLAIVFGKSQHENDLTNVVARNSSWLFVMHCAALGLGFFLNYLLVQLAGADNFGGYAYIFNLMYLLVSLCNLGIDTLVLSKAGVYHTGNQSSELKGLLIFAMLSVMAASIAVALITGSLPPLRMISQQKAYLNWILISIPALILLSVSAINQASLQSLGKIIYSHIIEKIVKPLLLIILVSVNYFASGIVTLQRLIWINIFVIGICGTITLLLNLKQVEAKLKRVAPVFETKNWIGAAWAFFLVSVLYMLNTRVDVFMLGLFTNNTEIGIYTIALRVSEVIGFALTIINLVLAPLIVRLSGIGSETKLQTIITSASRTALMVSLPLTLIIVLFSEQILQVFGQQFVAAQTALLILSFGQLVNVLVGSVGVILLMTGNQKYSIISLFTGTTTNIVLNLILAPLYGATGTAIASAASMIFWNCLMYYFIRKNTNIRTTAIKRF